MVSADTLFLVTIPILNFPSTGLNLTKTFKHSKACLTWRWPFKIQCQSESWKHTNSFGQCLTSRLWGAVVEALNWMDADLVQTSWDSPALQQTPAPDAKHYTFTFLFINVFTFIIRRHVDAHSEEFDAPVFKNLPCSKRMFITELGAK